MEKVFITKYALTEGILEKEAEICDYGHEIAYVKGEFSSYSLGKEAFRTREQAMERAEKMRLKKIASLKKTDRSIGKDEILKRTKSWITSMSTTISQHLKSLFYWMK